MPAQLSSPRADFALSFTTACMHMRRRHTALHIAQSLPGGGEGQGNGSGPAPSWSNLTGDTAVPFALRMHIPRLERFLLVLQLFAWNVSCIGSLVVCVVFWATLVSGTCQYRQQCLPLLPCVSHADHSAVGRRGSSLPAS